MRGADDPLACFIEESMRLHLQRQPHMRAGIHIDKNRLSPPHGEKPDEAARGRRKAARAAIGDVIERA